MQKRPGLITRIKKYLMVNSTKRLSKASFCAPHLIGIPVLLYTMRKRTSKVKKSLVGQLSQNKNKMLDSKIKAIQ
jgi:hypothetical protein